MAGGDVVIKSNSSPLIPIPSLSMRNSGKLLTGGVIVIPIQPLSVVAHKFEGKVAEISAPTVVVPLESEPVYK